MNSVDAVQLSVTCTTVGNIDLGNSAGSGTENSAELGTERNMENNVQDEHVIIYNEAENPLLPINTGPSGSIDCKGRATFISHCTESNKAAHCKERATFTTHSKDSNKAANDEKNSSYTADTKNDDIDIYARDTPIQAGDSHVKARDNPVKARDNPVQDRGWAWVVCCACFIVHVIYDGIYFSVGVVFVEFLDYFGRSKRDTAIIVSLCFGVGFLLGPLYAFLANRFGCRIVVVTGSIISSTAYILSIFAPNVYVMYLTFGLMSGFGYGCAYLPSILAINYYFNKRRALALGIAISGSGFGALLFGPLTRYFIHLYTWKGAVLMHAGIMLNVIACGLVYLPLDLKPSNVKETNNAEIQKSIKSQLQNESHDSAEDERLLVPLHDQTNNVVRKSLIDESIERNDTAIEKGSNEDLEISTEVQGIVCEYLPNSFPSIRDDIITSGPSVEGHVNTTPCLNGNGPGLSIVENSNSNNITDYPNDIYSDDACINANAGLFTNIVGSSKSITDYPHDRYSDDINPNVQVGPETGETDAFPVPNSASSSLFTNRPYVLFVISSSFTTLVYVTPFAFIPDKARDDGIDEFTSSWLISTLGVSGLIGRVLAGIISNIKRVNSVLLAAACIVVCGTCLALIPACNTAVPLFVCCIPLGMALGGSVTLSAVLVGEFVGRQNMAKAYGIINFAWGVTSLLGPPFIGWLYDVSGTYNISFITAGMVFASGGVVLCLVPLCRLKSGVLKFA